MMNLLLTGGTGFVGSHLAEQAQKEGYIVFALVRKSSNTKHLQELGITCLEAELTDRNSLEQVFQSLQQQQIQIHAAIHCAALTKAKNFQTFQFVNVTATQTLLNLLERFQPQLSRFIFVSSLAACGPTDYGNTISLEQADPITNYGRSKLEAEAVVRNSSLPHVIVRPTAVYGPKEKDIFTLFELISKGVFPLIGGHQQTLTFIYVQDLVDVLLKAIHTKAVDQTFFATDGQKYDKAALGNAVQGQLSKKPFRLTIPLPIVKGLAFVSQTFFGLQGKLAPLNAEKYKELKAASWDCEMDKTYHLLGFTPKYTLEKGVAKTVDWYQENGWI